MLYSALCFHLYIDIMPNYQEIAISFAGVCQAASLVQQFAYHGTADTDAFRHSLSSLLVMQPKSVMHVFGDDLHHLKLGFETALAQTGGGGKLDQEIGRYWISIIALSHKLAANPEAKNALAERLQHLERNILCNARDMLDEQTISALADIYSEIISPLGSRIHVLGSQSYLSQPNVQNRIRAALLAGIRAAILWQQVGGKRLQFLFSRKKILQAAKSLYSTL